MFCTIESALASMFVIKDKTEIAIDRLDDGKTYIKGIYEVAAKTIVPLDLACGCQLKSQKEKE